MAFVIGTPTISLDWAIFSRANCNSHYRRVLTAVKLVVAFLGNPFAASYSSIEMEVSAHAGAAYFKNWLILVGRLLG